jgi:putative NADPH-quinone reductase
MGKRIAIIQGHPSPEPKHLGHALADAYAESARAAGHEVRRVDVAQLEFPLLRTADEWKSGALPEGLRDAQAAIAWANHLVVIFPLWTGTMPALLKGFLEHIVRPGFAFRPRPNGGGLAPALTGKSARVIVTMGMPALFFRWTYHSNAVRGLKRSILGFCGIKPIAMTYIGSVDTKSFNGAKWLETMRQLGRAGG